ncbi:MAG: NFACT RNA binding domain-containing protein [Nanobdellota archaeon]
MKITIDLDQTVEQNASDYFDKAKRMKKKLEGARTALEKSKEKLEKKEEEEPAEEEERTILRKKQWYEKFRWFFTSEGFLCIGGRDATTNEIVVKKHTDKDDLIFHTDMAGSPFFVIKSEGKEIGEKSIEETAQVTASYSKAWAEGLATLDVFYAQPDQVSKEAESGEFMPKGSFMVRGKNTYLEPRVELSLGFDGEKVIVGTVDSVKQFSDKVFVIQPGSKKTSDVAKLAKKKLGGDLDEIIRMIPPGGSRVKDR